MKDGATDKGFTLIELIVVMAIIAILVLLAAPRFLGYTKDANVTAMQQDTKVLSDAVEMYHIDKNEWPIVGEAITGHGIDGVDELYQIDESELKNSIKNIKGDVSEYRIVIDGKQEGNIYHLAGVKDREGVVIHGKNYHSAPLIDEAKEEWERLVEASSDNYVLASDDDFIQGETGDFIYVGTDEFVIIPEKIHGKTLTNYKNMFHKTLVKGVASYNPKVTHMNRMFEYAKTKALDLTFLDTRYVTDMSYMFWVSDIEELDISNFNTSKVTTTSHMFQFIKVNNLDVSSFDTKNVTSMFAMFADTIMPNLDITNFDTSNVENMDSMFIRTRMNTLDFSNFNTDKVKTMKSMFKGSAVKTLDLSSFNTNSVNNMLEMFEDSGALVGYAKTQRDADNFNSTIQRPNNLNFIVKE